MSFGVTEDSCPAGRGVEVRPRDDGGVECVDVGPVEGGVVEVQSSKASLWIPVEGGADALSLVEETPIEGLLACGPKRKEDLVPAASAAPWF